MLRYKTN